MKKNVSLLSFIFAILISVSTESAETVILYDMQEDKILLQTGNVETEQSPISA